MKKFERLDETTTPDGTVLTLYRHDGEYTIRINNVELMSTRRHHSEEALAGLACAALGEVADARVLIGGLGFGFTLRATLRLLAADARVVVAELLPAVVRWNRNPEYDLAGAALDDLRVNLCVADVAQVLRDSPGTFDSIILDVDNGANALTTAGNAQLYQDEGIRLAVGALRQGGRLAYWSADEDRKFEGALQRAGLRVTTTTARAHTTSGGYHALIVAKASARAIRKLQ